MQKFGTPGLKQIFGEFFSELDKLTSAYKVAINHIDTVASASLNQANKKMESYKKEIKAEDKQGKYVKLMDYEFDRLEGLEKGLLHYFNAQMFLHAKAMEIFAKLFKKFQDLKVSTEFPEFDKTHVLRAMHELNIKEDAPEGATVAALA